MIAGIKQSDVLDIAKILWPGEDSVRATLSLCEEAGEAARAALKLDHRRRGVGDRQNEVPSWRVELGCELAQVVVVAMHIAGLEGIPLDNAVRSEVRSLGIRAQNHQNHLWSQATAEAIEDQGEAPSDESVDAPDEPDLSDYFGRALYVLGDDLADGLSPYIHNDTRYFDWDSMLATDAMLSTGEKATVGAARAIYSANSWDVDLFALPGGALERFCTALDAHRGKL